jgi:RNA polymerase sigma-70 factor (ECF subfamily)
MKATGSQATAHLAALEKRRALAAWVARELLPHEPIVRAMLRKMRAAPEEIDEVVQDCYCRFAMLESLDHIEQPRAYFKVTAKHLLGRRMQRARVVHFDAYNDMSMFIDEETPSQERQLTGRSDYALLLKLMSKLPDRCRKAVELRKIEGLSQKQIAQKLGMSEKAVEKQIWLGVRALREGWAKIDAQADLRMGVIRRAKP